MFRASLNRRPNSKPPGAGYGAGLNSQPRGPGGLPSVPAWPEAGAVFEAFYRSPNEDTTRRLRNCHHWLPFSRIRGMCHESHWIPGRGRHPESGFALYPCGSNDRPSTQEPARSSRPALPAETDECRCTANVQAVQCLHRQPTACVLVTCLSHGWAVDGTWACSGSGSHSSRLSLLGVGNSPARRAASTFVECGLIPRSSGTPTACRLE
jgi:hypothetical protein